VKVHRVDTSGPKIGKFLHALARVTY
jgi:hypothetical protein